MAPVFFRSFFHVLFPTPRPQPEVHHQQRGYHQRQQRSAVADVDSGSGVPDSSFGRHFGDVRPGKSLNGSSTSWRRLCTEQIYLGAEDLACFGDCLVAWVPSRPPERHKRALCRDFRAQSLAASASSLSPLPLRIRLPCVPHGSWLLAFTSVPQSG